MGDLSKLNETSYQFLLHLFDTGTTYDIHEFLSHSTIYTEDDFRIKDALKFYILINPEIFKKYQNIIKQIEDSISFKFYNFSHRHVSSVETFPDLNKFQILENRIVPIFTPWQEINSSQNHLLELQRTAKESIDFQNVGNSCRTILQKLAEIVFIPTKHICEDITIDLSAGKFKNRLHTYIRTELGGTENKELRDYALAVITAAEKSVDLANKLTHDLKATPFMAESCVISTVTVISIIKLIEK